MLKVFPSLNNCSICFLLLSLSFLPNVNCFATIIDNKNSSFKEELLNYIRYPGPPAAVWGLLQFFLRRNSQFLAAFCTTACQYLTAISGLHTLAKTMNGFAAAAMWLKCTFHNFLLFHFFLNDAGETRLFHFSNRSPHLLFVKGRQR